jgi:HPt (histidine-containing phosphotransfer) domain-containing protein
MRADTLASTEILNIQDTLTRFGGDQELFRDMTAILLEDAPRLERELRVAVDANDATAIEMKSHALKGLVAGCGGERAAIAAQKLEDAGHRNELQETASHMARLTSELNVLQRAIQAWHQKNPAC